MSSPREVIYETLEVYDEISRGYSSWRSRAWEVVKVLRGGVVLDLGSGHCVNGVHLALEKRADHLICMDIAPSMLLEARDLARRKKFSKADFVAADATAIPLRGLAVDSVISIALAHHLPTTELRKAFIEIARILKPEGLALVTSWSRRQLRFVAQTFILYVKKLLGFPGPSVYRVKWRTRRRVYTRKYFLHEVSDLERAAREAGLEIVFSGYVKQFKNLNSLIIAMKTSELR
ncbi:MAG: class I SAM-dependent methyltransferase [Sulfolobales archaeon]|nr:class I SAM-dependent methyltransferase [Sulfolobales archaeon]MCX8208910.1 class I SAM-dependent methyltransferase [Sulfolobales archaeon]MDW8011013.1 class I SAM-dependent methyltransferase [Sulfolobales archaeon]